MNKYIILNIYDLNKIESRENNEKKKILLAQFHLKSNKKNLWTAGKKDRTDESLPQFNFLFQFTCLLIQSEQHINNFLTDSESFLFVVTSIATAGRKLIISTVGSAVGSF